MAFAVIPGCMVGPDYKRPETKVSETWNGQEAVTKSTPSKTTANPAEVVLWWNNFKDPTLSSLVEMAVRSNLDLRQAESRIRQARAALGVAGGPLYPQVDANLQYQRSSRSTSQAVSPGGVGPSGLATTGAFSELFQVGLDASWEIDIFGGIRRNIEAAGADLKAAVEDRRDVLVTLVGDVGNNYLSLRGFQQQLAVARKNLEVQQKTASIIRRRFEAGFVPRLDVANADAQAATTAAAIPVLESQARAAIYSLGVLLGREPAVLEKDLIKEGPIPPIPPQVPVGLPSDLIRRRPDIRKTEAQLHAATARIGVATADLFPKFNLTGSLGVSSSDLTKLGNMANSKFWSFGPAVTWPVFAGGRLWWNVRLQDALAEQALLNYQKTVLTALKDVETALVAYAKEQERRQALAEAVDNNRQAVDLAMKLYIAGKADFLNVTTAQRNLFVNEDLLVQSIRTVDTNLIALYKALGGGWENIPALTPTKPPANIILPLKNRES
ncbi:MAG: efflux transporter outer membrane subunit [Deltaproteobacteria bacterium]|nr:efflux transporter outer membrane subunit [Deltaproteobacteria bacterium]